MSAKTPRRTRDTVFKSQMELWGDSDSFIRITEEIYRGTDPRVLAREYALSGSPEGTYPQLGRVLRREHYSAKAQMWAREIAASMEDRRSHHLRDLAKSSTDALRRQMWEGAAELSEQLARDIRERK